VPPNYLETDTVTYYSESGTDIYVSESVSGMLNAVIMSVLLYGQMIGRAVLMEKNSKTVEIMLSSVRPGLAGILQYGVWIVIAVVIMQIAWPLILFLVLPMTAPVVMFVRLLISSPAAWEVLLCIGIMIVSIFLTAAGAAKIFRVGILMTGKKYTFREIIRWVRY
jgi:ABC-type Na+ efflux pump permease subunit